MVFCKPGSLVPPQVHHLNQALFLKDFSWIEIAAEARSSVPRGGLAPRKPVELRNRRSRPAAWLKPS